VLEILFENFRVFFTQLHHEFRAATVLDIAIVSVFIYSAIIWFRETTSRLVFVGFLLVGAVYLLARVFDLYLTSALFHLGFAFIALVLVITFQEDIRRFFERVAVWGIYGRRRRQIEVNEGMDVIVESVAFMSKMKWGGILVLKGRDPLRRHIQGEQALQGRISKAVILSLFEPNSPGHDGAIISDGSRILSFSAHLPLTRNPSQVEGRGTRHSAALGLSERTDAFVIVVSEEDGQISIAHSGELRKISTPIELKVRLESFLESKSRKENPKSLFRHELLKANLSVKVISIVIATFIWAIFCYKGGVVVQRTFSIPIEFKNIKNNMYVSSVVPHEVRVTFSAKQAAFSLLDPATLKVSVDLNNLDHEGTVNIELKDSYIYYPSNLSLYWMEPKKVKVQVASSDMGYKK